MHAHCSLDLMCTLPHSWRESIFPLLESRITLWLSLTDYGGSDVCNCKSESWEVPLLVSPWEHRTRMKAHIVWEVQPRASTSLLIFQWGYSRLGSLEKYFPISCFKDIALIPFNWSSFRKKYWGGLCVGSCQHSVHILLVLLSTEVLSPGLSIP